MQKASETLAKILKAGDPAAMKKELMILNAKGALDDSVVSGGCWREGEGRKGGWGDRGTGRTEADKSRVVVM